MYTDEKARKDVRYRVNLNQYQAAAVEALARLHQKQPASYLAEIIKVHLDSFIVEEREKRLGDCA